MEKSDTPVVLITGGRAPVALDLVRHFAAAGWRVLVADSVPVALAGRSRHAARYFRVPGPALDYEGFIAAIRRIILQENVGLLLPTCEEIFHVARGRAALPCPVFAPPLAVLRRLHSKWEFNQLLGQLCLPQLPSQRCTRPEALREAALARPAVVLKPEFSRFGTEVVIRPGVDFWQKKATNLEVSETRPWVVQEFAAGGAFCSYSVAQAGRLTAHAVYAARWRFRGGATVHFEAVEVPQIEAIVQKIAAHLQLNGQLSFDFIQADADGLFYAIECNPRATSGLHLFENQPLATQFLAGAGLLLRPRPGASRMLALPMLLAAPSYPNRAFWRAYAVARDAIFYPRDPGPALAQLPALAHYAGVAFRQKRSLTAATTYDLEWNG